MDILEKLKNKFKENIYKTGIYKIYFKNHSYFYIGLASREHKFNCYSGFYNRWKRHVRDLEKGIHVNIFLQRMYNKYGEQNLEFEILEFCSPENAPDRELYWFKLLKPPMNFQGNKKYVKPECKPIFKNIRKERKPHTEKTKLKMSKAAKNRVYKKYIYSKEKVLQFLLYMRKNKTSYTKSYKNLHLTSNNLKESLKKYNLEKISNYYAKLNLKSIKKEIGNKNKGYTIKTQKEIANIIFLYKSLSTITAINKITKINEDLILKIVEEEIINYNDIKMRNRAEAQLKNKKIAPNNITYLKQNEIFVFGSNEIGIHSAGAAKTAVDKFGAIYGKGEGLQGNSYALPTKDKNIITLNLDKIENYINNFKKVVESNPNKIFILTAIGCGLAGYKPSKIAPLFKELFLLENIRFPNLFYKILIKL